MNNWTNNYPSLSVTGVSWVHSSGPAEAEIISKNYKFIMWVWYKILFLTNIFTCLTAVTCCSVYTDWYIDDIYSSLKFDREQTRLPKLWIVFDTSVRVRFVWESYKKK